MFCGFAVVKVLLLPWDFTLLPWDFNIFQLRPQQGGSLWEGRARSLHLLQSFSDIFQREVPQVHEVRSTSKDSQV